MDWRRWICRLTRCHVDPGGDGLVYCPRCGDLFNVDIEREIDGHMQAW